MNIELVKYPDTFLRTKSEEVKFPLDDKTQRLIKWMIKSMYLNYGIGLAAVQVGYHSRIFVMDCTRAGESPKIFINPTVTKKSDETLTDFEGCLSAPGKRGEVARHLRITLKYQDKEGEEHTKTFYNIEARCIQHELDHLEGKLCIDYGKANDNNRQEDNLETMVESDFRTKSNT
jgi:peptide deformylase